MVEMTDTLKDKESGKPEKPDLQTLSFIDRQEFENWLEQNNTVTSGIWIRIFKKDSGMLTISYNEALNVALCYGWIDGQVKKHDENSYIQKFTPRRSKSMWSKRNIDLFNKLEEEGKVKPSGRKEAEKAKTDGRWERAYDSPGNMVVPDDFIQKISKNKKAFAFFESLNKTNKYTIGWRLQTAKTEITRQKRMEEILRMMEQEHKFH
jgi:uncharacterized protein YdeI (YjbR/CyaY-like superfamily)